MKNQNALRQRQRACRGKAFNIRGLDSDIAESWRLWCGERQYPLNRAITDLMRQAVENKERVAIKRRGLNSDSSINVRGVHTNVMRRFKAHCVLFGWRLGWAIEALMLRAMRENIALNMKYQGQQDG